ncbi:hypothetical protein [Erwinia sp. QL-Z3]|jgi:hypothetical protein|uniref:hypothetical protein n=1 Tax=Erwinia sp. QL-Z3 TaxID=2547962 RepID=UPI0010709ACD|nr:hypothetical protein [Erwinia sp. QL-Z3]QBR48587.1 hypothetical protein E2F51_00655 [Erwinia sp. QL-Z3]
MADLYFRPAATDCATAGMILREEFSLLYPRVCTSRRKGLKPFSCPVNCHNARSIQFAVKDEASEFKHKSKMRPPFRG